MTCIAHHAFADTGHCDAHVLNDAGSLASLRDLPLQMPKETGNYLLTLMVIRAHGSSVWAYKSISDLSLVMLSGQTLSVTA